LRGKGKRASEVGPILARIFVHVHMKRWFAAACHGSAEVQSEVI